MVDLWNDDRHGLPSFRSSCCHRWQRGESVSHRAVYPLLWVRESQSLLSGPFASHRVTCCRWHRRTPRRSHLTARSAKVMQHPHVLTLSSSNHHTLCLVQALELPGDAATMPTTKISAYTTKALTHSANMRSSIKSYTGYSVSLRQRELRQQLLKVKTSKELKVLARRYQIPCYTVMTKAELSHTIAVAMDYELTITSTLPSPNKLRFLMASSVN